LHGQVFTGRKNYQLKSGCNSVFSPCFLKEEAVIIVAKTIYMYQPTQERIRIARNIRLIRELRNYDQRYVASALNVGRSTLSTWENGVTEVRIETLIRLAEVLGLENYRQIIDFDPDALFKKKTDQ
jgi:DNA-binding XRE family transcriptional regulator